jgi:hypothetical protein
MEKCQLSDKEFAERKALFEYREHFYMLQVGDNYQAPVGVQFGITSYENLSDENKVKFDKILERGIINKDGLLNEIWRYDTSVLDHILSSQF